MQETRPAHYGSGAFLMVWTRRPMVVFLVEELSMVDFLNELLPRLFPDLEFRCVPHEGKTDLEGSLVRVLRSWRTPGVRFVVMRDQNGGDCHAVKDKLNALCAQGQRPDSLVRVVCRELEAWYIGDMEALTAAFPDAGKRIRRELRKRRFHNPDDVVQPARALSALIPQFQKRSSARSLGRHLSRENRSRSYQVFLAGVERLLSEGTPEACA